MKKRRKVMIAAALLSVGMAFTGYASGWQQNEADGRWKYYYDNGGFATGQVLRIDKKNYLFDSEGYMVTGWKNMDGWYYADPSGVLSKGWQMVDNKWYFFDNDYKMMTGWIKVKNRNYYMREDGSMQTGTFEVDGECFTADPETGSVIRNKKYLSNKEKKIKYNTDGSMELWNESKKIWEPIIDSQTYKYCMIEKLQQDYASGKYTEEKFEEEATKNLKAHMTKEELDDFITDCIFHYAPDLNSDYYDFDYDIYYD